jgi:hypothetical protein
MTQKLDVSFNSPQCGWMSIGFSDGVNDFHTTTAHAPHEFALPELLQILTALLDDERQDHEYVLKWNRDPEEFDFRFIRRGESVTIEIYQYPTMDRDTGERELVFTYHGDAEEVCRAFSGTFAQLHADRFTDDFEINWHQPFPEDDFKRFEARLSEKRIRSGA